MPNTETCKRRYATRFRLVPEAAPPLAGANESLYRNRTRSNTMSYDRWLERKRFFFL